MTADHQRRSVCHDALVSAADHQTLRRQDAADDAWVALWNDDEAHPPDAGLGHRVTS
jgi:hypothetical protein